ncbi:MAG: hypothetical protein ACXVPU_15925 [Bacteroidia bacterium]
MEKKEAKDDRIEKIQEQILRFALKDFSLRVPVSDKCDDIDAIIAGLNVLGEELELKK